MKFSEYKPCPKCTYPLKRVELGEEDGKWVIRIFCSNNKCDYEHIYKRSKK